MACVHAHENSSVTWSCDDFVVKCEERCEKKKRNRLKHSHICTWTNTPNVWSQIRKSNLYMDFWTIVYGVCACLVSLAAKQQGAYAFIRSYVHTEWRTLYRRFSMTDPYKCNSTFDMGCVQAHRNKNKIHLSERTRTNGHKNKSETNAGMLITYTSSVFVFVGFGVIECQWWWRWWWRRRRLWNC